MLAPTVMHSPARLLSTASLTLVHTMMPKSPFIPSHQLGPGVLKHFWSQEPFTLLKITAMPVILFLWIIEGGVKVGLQLFIWKII